MYLSLNFPFYDKLNYAGIVIGSYLRYNPLEDKCFDDITITTNHVKTNRFFVVMSLYSYRS